MATLQHGSEHVAESLFTSQHRKGIMLAFAIDKQNDPETSIGSLGDAIKLGCNYITKIFVDKKMVDRDSCSVFYSSTHPDECSEKGIQNQIRECSESVGKNGLLVLFLSGHGMHHGFIPGDYSAKKGNSISARSLSKCLASVWSSIGNILVILDCCFAGKLAKSLAALVPRNVWILSACTGGETTLAFESLGCSVFTYLVGRAINNLSDSSEDLSGLVVSTASLNAIHRSCTASVKALTALSSDESHHYESGLQQGRRHVDVDGDVPTILDEIIKWLEGGSEHIRILIKERAFEDERLCGKEKRVLKIALSLMMYSVAWLELISRKSESTTSPDPNRYLTSFNKAVEIFHNLNYEFEVTSELRLQCLEFYWDVVEKALIGQQELKEDIEKCYEELRKSLGDQGYVTDKSKGREWGIESLIKQLKVDDDDTTSS